MEKNKKKGGNTCFYSMKSRATRNCDKSQAHPGDKWKMFHGAWQIFALHGTLHDKLQESAPKYGDSFKLRELGSYFS